MARRKKSNVEWQVVFITENREFVSPGLGSGYEDYEQAKDMLRKVLEYPKDKYDRIFDPNLSPDGTVIVGSQVTGSIHVHLRISAIVAGEIRRIERDEGSE